ncbi:unnamed protein product, partial [Vitrella brassicaformis CCMP3155]
AFACKDSSAKYVLEQYEEGVKDTYDEFDGVLAFKRLKAKMESNPAFAEFSAQREFDAFAWDIKKSALDNNAEFKRLAGKVNAQKEVLTATALKHAYIKVVPTAYKLPISEKIIKSDVTVDDAMERVRKLETAAAIIGASPGQHASMGVGAATTPMDVDEGARAAGDGESINCKYCLNDGYHHSDCKRLTHNKKMYGITLFPSSHRMKRAAELLNSQLEEVERKEKQRVIKDNNKGKNNKYNKGHDGGVRHDRHRRDADADWFRELLNREYGIKDLGKADVFVGIKIERDPLTGEMKLSQRAYIEKILKRFRWEHCNPASTPVASGVKLSKDHCPSTPEEKE